MAFQLKAKESLSEGIRRNVHRQIEKALEHLGAERQPHARGASEGEPDAKDVRKCFKRVRAALRLVREDLGDETYRDENFCFRDAGRLLREIRDAQVLVEAVEKLTAQSTASAEAEAWAKIHAILLANRRDVARRVLDEGAPAAVEDMANEALARIPGWRIEHDGWAAMERGLRRVYRAGQRALALATENPSMQNLHEWRKQSRHLRGQLQLLEPAWSEAEKGLGEHAQKVTQLLGADHDLAILRETLADDPVAYGGHRVLKGLFAVIDRRRAELERQAFDVGATLYKDPAKVFTSRIETYWKTWTGQAETPKPPTTDRQAQGGKVRPRGHPTRTAPVRDGAGPSRRAAGRK